MGKTKNGLPAYQFEIDLTESVIRVSSIIVAVLSLLIFWWANYQHSSLRAIYDIWFSLFVALIIMAYALGPRISIWQFKAVPYTEVDLPNRTLREVCKLYQLSSSPKLYVSSSSSSSPCSFVGTSLRNSVLIINKPLLEFLNDDDWKAVFAHELAHFQNKDLIFITWAKSYLWMIKYWFAAFSLFLLTYVFASGQPLPSLLDYILRFSVIALLIFILPAIIVNSICRLREKLADARASLLVGSMSMRDALRQVALSIYLSNVISSKVESRSDLRSYIRRKIPSQVYGFLFAQAPKPKERIEALMSHEYIKSKQSYTAPSNATFFWIGLTAFLVLTGIEAPVLSALLEMKLIPTISPFLDLLGGLPPFLILIFLSNLWLWRSDRQVLKSDFYSKGNGKKYSSKRIVVFNGISVGTYIWLVYLIGGANSSILLETVLLFLIYWLAAFIVSSGSIMVKVILAKLENRKLGTHQF